MATKQISARENSRRRDRLEDSNRNISIRLGKINKEMQELAEERDRLLNAKIENTRRINDLLAEVLATTERN